MSHPVTRVCAQYTQFGLLWWQSQLVSYLFRPDQNLQKLIAENEAFLSRPYASMHIRYHPLKKAGMPVHVRHGGRSRVGLDLPPHPLPLQTPPAYADGG